MIYKYATIQKQCEECYEEYTGVQFDNDRCAFCERTYHIKRIADALEHWVGLH